MVKDLALNNVWAPLFSKTKKYSFVKTPAKTSNVRLWLAVGLVVVNAVLLMSYIYGVNDYANKGYEISVLQNKLSNLSQDNKKVNLQVAQAASMVSIQTDFLNANFVVSGTPKFIQTQAPQLSER